MMCLALLLASCATPVLRSDLLQHGFRDVPMARIAQSPSPYVGKLFILGGSIVSTTLSEKGSLLEVIDMPVDANGHFIEATPTGGRFLAFYARELGVLDPVVYRAGRRVTLAGEFVEIRPGRIEEMEYAFPYFDIRQLYLWEEGQAVRAFPPPNVSIGIGVGVGVGGRW